MADNHERLDQFKKPDKGTEFGLNYKVPSFNVRCYYSKDEYYDLLMAHITAALSILFVYISKFHPTTEGSLSTHYSALCIRLESDRNTVGHTH